MKKIILIVVVIAVLGAAGMLAYHLSLIHI